jgi:hypothetical protein
MGSFKETPELFIFARQAAKQLQNCKLSYCTAIKPDNALNVPAAQAAHTEEPAERAYTNQCMPVIICSYEGQ